MENTEPERLTSLELHESNYGRGDLEEFIIRNPCARNHVDVNNSQANVLPNQAFSFIHYCSNYNLPYFTSLIVLIIWCAYCYGLFFMFEGENVKANLYSPISPPDTRLWFIYVGWWPGCADHRYQWWRLISLQLVHSGLLHIISNSIVAIIYGIIFESSQGSFRTFLIFEMGVIGGTICHGNIFPYSPLVGCSAGVYGTIGGNIANAIMNYDSWDSRHLLFVILLLVAQIFSDILTFLFMYESNIGYAAHFSAMIIGFLLGLSISYRKQKKLWKYILSRISMIAFFLFFFILIFFYSRNWPPQMMIKPWTPSPIKTNYCCSELFHIKGRTWPIEDASDYFTCTDNGLVSNH